jgi:hypothetical protein
MSEKLFDPGAPEIFVSGLGEVEAIGGGCYRFTFVTKSHDGAEVAVKLIAHTDTVPTAALKAIKAVGYCIAKDQFCVAQVH